MDNSYIDDFIQEMLDEDLKQSPEVMEKKMLYSQLMTEYLNQHGLDPTEDYSELIAGEFEMSNDLDTKIKVLGDALDKGILLEKSAYYPELLEGTKDDELPPVNMGHV